MKRLSFLIPLLLLWIASWGQSVTLTDFVGKFQFSGFAAGGTSDVTGLLDAFSDQTNLYFASGIQVGDIVWDNQGNRWEVMVVNSSNLLQADVDLRDINEVGGTPIGVGFVSRETPNMGLSLFVPDNNIGISQQLKSRIESHNMLLIDQYVAANQDSVFSGATAADTSSITDPAVGDVLVAEDGTTAYYDGDSWVVSDPGASSTWLKPELEAGQVVINAGINNFFIQDANGGSFSLGSGTAYMLKRTLGQSYTSGIQINHPTSSRYYHTNNSGYRSDLYMDGNVNARYQRLIGTTGNFYSYMDGTAQQWNLYANPGGVTQYLMRLTPSEVWMYNNRYRFIDAAPPYAQSLQYWDPSGIPGWLDASALGGGSPDGNGIYSGSGNVPDATEATLAEGGVFTFKDQEGNDRLRITEQNNIAITATTGFTATTTSGTLGLTHTGSSGQLVIQSLDERATFQGEDTRIKADTMLTLDVAGGTTELTVKDSLIKVGYLADEVPAVYLGLNADRELVETTSVGGGDNWGSQVVIHDGTLSGNGTAGSPLTVVPGTDDNGIISALPAGNVNISNTSDNDLLITQNNGNQMFWEFGGVNGPAISVGDLANGPAATIDGTQLYLADEDGNSATYTDNGMFFNATNGVLNSSISEYNAGTMDLRMNNASGGAGNLFPAINLRQYGPSYPVFRFSNGEDLNGDIDLFDTDPIATNRILGSLQFHGQYAAGNAFNNANNRQAAGINATSREAFTNTNTGARLEFFTTPIGTTGIQSTMILEDDGRLRLPNMFVAAAAAPVFDYQMDGSGYLIKTSATHDGTFSGSTDGSGEVTITHSVGTAPDYAHMVITSTSTPYFTTLVSTTTTQATFKVWDATDGSAVTSTAIAGSWIVK